MIRHLAGFFMSDSSQTDLMGESWKYNPDYHRLSDFFGIDIHDRQDFNLAKKVAFLDDWTGTKIPKGTLQDRMAEMIKVRKTLGIPTIGKDLVGQLYQIARLEVDRGMQKKEDQVRKARVVEEKKSIPVDPEIKKKMVQQAMQKQVQSLVQKSLPKSKEVESAVKSQVSGMVSHVLRDKRLLSDVIAKTLKESFS